MFTSNVAHRFDIQHKAEMREESKHFDRIRQRRGTNMGEIVMRSLDKQQELRVKVHHLVRLVEKQAEVCKDHPELLPAIAVLELP